MQVVLHIFRRTIGSNGKNVIALSLESASHYIRVFQPGVQTPDFQMKPGAYLNDSLYL
jgi:hypothetical protein